MTKLINFLLFTIFMVSCATVVKNDNFETPTEFKAPISKVSLSISVFVKLYDENGEFYGHGYDSELSNKAVDVFKESKAFRSVTPKTSPCSEDYVCLDLPTTSKIKTKRHLTIIFPEKYPKKTFSPFWKILSGVTLGLVPSFYRLELEPDVNLFNQKRENLYTDDSTYEAKALSALWLNFSSEKVSEKSKEHYDVFYDRVLKKILWNVLFQMRKFP